jgi:hypothetical protein
MHDHRVHLHGLAGGLLLGALVVAFIGTLALMAKAQRPGSDQTLARLAWQSIIAAFICNAVANLWSAISLLWWVVFPLQALSVVSSVIVLRRHRRRSADVDIQAISSEPERR